MATQDYMLDVKINTAEEFHKAMELAPNSKGNFIWRGQSDENWDLESSLHRMLKSLPILEHKKYVNKHLELFKNRVRGRRGLNPEKISTDNEWWGLGQHYGLKTPLLDWTRSAYIAAYFAFLDVKNSKSNNVAVYGLNTTIVGLVNNSIASKSTSGKDEQLLIHEPQLEDNHRIISQGGLFTISPIGANEGDWLETYTSTRASKKPYPCLRFLLPKSIRKDFLILLDFMNISHSSLFPDISGSSEYCNTHLELELTPTGGQSGTP